MGTKLHASNAVGPQRPYSARTGSREGYTDFRFNNNNRPRGGGFENAASSRPWTLARGRTDKMPAAAAAEVAMVTANASGHETPGYAERARPQRERYDGRRVRFA